MDNMEDFDFESFVKGTSGPYIEEEHERQKAEKEASKEEEKRVRRERDRRELEAQREEAYERSLYESALAKKELDVLKTEKEKQELKKKKFERYQATKGEITKTAGQVAKAFSPAGPPGGTSRFYLGGNNRRLYVPETPKVSSAIPRASASSAELMRPDLRQLQRATTLSAGTGDTYARQLVAPPSRAGALQYGFLRDIALPSGTSKLEKFVFAEIRGNHDVDTMGHIQDEVSRLGYGRSAIERAVLSLESKGLVEKQKQLSSGQTEYVVR